MTEEAVETTVGINYDWKVRKWLSERTAIFVLHPSLRMNFLANLERDVSTNTSQLQKEDYPSN